ncbi:uncharacterized protein LOC143866938 [Tasmannia lanceolata]|uniref:uncharacterized protein LOC143865569 n=1 Tax=Tasmannia lanceolata TaxID=3420 RepID=UPI0040632446
MHDDSSESSDDDEVLAEAEEAGDAGNPWYYDIKNFNQEGSFPNYATKADRKYVRQLATRYVLLAGVLYKRSFEGRLLRCLDKEEAQHAIRELHSGLCGGHVNSQMLAKKIIRQGSYWPTMGQDCHKFVRGCMKCQIHADLIHAPSSSLYPMSSLIAFRGENKNHFH